MSSAEAVRAWVRLPSLEGRHVRLEPLGPEHVPDLLQAAQDDEVWRYLPARRPRSADDLLRLVAEAAAEAARGERLALAVIARDDGRAIGSTSYLDLQPVHSRIEVGWTWLARERWRTAINTEAKLLLLAHAFERIGVERLALKTDRRNRRSQAAIARLGARREGVLRRHQRCPDGSLRDTVWYSILRDEWPAVAARLRAALAAGDRR